LTIEHLLDMMGAMSDFQRWLQWNESQTFERKSCYQRSPNGPVRRPPGDVAREIAETLCAMANADGGVVLAGQENVRQNGEDGPGDVTGVDYSADALALLRSASQRLIVPPLEDAEGREESVEGRRILIFQTRSSPVPHHLTNGRCLLRVGTHNVPQSERVIVQLKEAQSPYERRPVSDATVADLDREALDWFAAKIGWQGNHEAMLREYYLLEELGLNRAAMLLFAARPRRWHDHPDVVIVRYAGKERGLGADYEAQPPIRVERPLVRQVAEAHAALSQQIRRRVELRDLFFQEQWEYPQFAWQEAVVNAIAHRDYSLGGAGIEIWLFDDRMEVRSPGLLPEPITLDRLRAREGVHFSRNPLIARVLIDSGYMREQGEGIPRMFQEMESADLQPPELTIQDFRFVVTLRNTPVYDRETLRWLRRFAGVELSRDQKRVLALAASRGGYVTSREVQKQLGMDLYGASNLIKSLIRKNVVRLPEKGGRVYEVVDPGEPDYLPSQLAVLLPSFEQDERLTRRALAELWNVSSSRAYLNARALVEDGWLTMEGAGRGAGYRLTARAKNAKVS
jgi:ATP-dependent DNA helicase RecG